MYNFFDDYSETLHVDSIHGDHEEQVLQYIDYYFDKNLTQHIFFDIEAVDTSAHGNSVLSEAFSKSVLQVEEMFETAISKLKDEDLLVIFSDHGLLDADIYAHGGSQEEARAAFFFAYSKSIEFQYEQVNSLISSSDVAAVFSGLLNIPPPFMSLGTYEQGVIHGEHMHEYNIGQLKSYAQKLKDEGHIDQSTLDMALDLSIDLSTEDL